MLHAWGFGTGALADCLEFHAGKQRAAEAATARDARAAPAGGAGRPGRPGPVRVTVLPGLEPGRADLLLPDRRSPYPRGWRVTGLSEHDLRDIEFALAQRRAMSRRCDAEDGEHTCAQRPEHPGEPHLCRACPRTWPLDRA